jgi:Repeating coiled region of VPS13
MLYYRDAPAPVLVVSLGSLAVNSCASDKGRPNISNMLHTGSTDQEVLQEMISKSYDKFLLSLKDVQVINIVAYV